MQYLRALLGQTQKKTGDSASPSGRFCRIIIYTCIAFFVIALIFVGFTYCGRWQAGLIEVSSSAFLFVIFLHIIKVVIPQSTGKIIMILSIVTALLLIFTNFSLQRNYNKGYTFRELLVGDLLVKKLMGKQEELPDEQLSKRLKKVIPGEFAQTKTENDTVESPFERPEKDLMGTPVTMPIDRLSVVSTPIQRGKPLSLYIPPEETVKYTLKVAGKEDLSISSARIVPAGFTTQIDTRSEQIAGPHPPVPLYRPAEGKIDYSALQPPVYREPEKPAGISEPEMQPALPEEHLEKENGGQEKEKLQTQ